jgi:hypothetical protein
MILLDFLLLFFTSHQEEPHERQFDWMVNVCGIYSIKEKKAAANQNKYCKQTNNKILKKMIQENNI